MWNAGRLELPRGQPRALEQRPCLVDEHALEQASLPRRAERADRRSVAARGEPARVAVRERPRAGLEEVCRMRGHPLAALDLFAMQRACPLGRGIVPHVLECPEEVDGGRPRGRKHPLRLREILAAQGRERETVGGCHADRGRAADRELCDRLCHLGGGTALELHLLVREPALVEEEDARRVYIEPHDPLRIQNRHESVTQPSPLVRV